MPPIGVSGVVKRLGVPPIPGIESRAVLYQQAGG
jgi:hypothetical protein